MHAISKVCIIDDDIIIASLTTGEEVQLFELGVNGKTYYKVKQGNRIVPVGTKLSGCFFTELTRRIYM